jgi:hypothetical protein
MEGSAEQLVERKRRGPPCGARFIQLSREWDRRGAKQRATRGGAGAIGTDVNRERQRYITWPKLVVNTTRSPTVRVPHHHGARTG